MAVVYRRAKRDDIPAVVKVWAAAFRELNERRGFEDQQGHSPAPFFEFTLQQDPEGFWVAENDNSISGMAISSAQGSFWFLAYLFILPASQGQGIGQNLLKKALEYSRQIQITNRALITLAYNPVSIGLYMHYGMYPREPLYKMTGSSVDVRLSQTGVELFEHEKLQPTQDSLMYLCRIDEQVLGIYREKSHQYFLSAPNAECYLFRKNGIPEGYAYVWSDGHVGPLATLSPVSFKGVVNTALRWASTRGSNRVSVIIPGSSEQGMAIALEYKLQITLPFLLMSSQPFGNWATYLFHSAALMCEEFAVSIVTHHLGR